MVTGSVLARGREAVGVGIAAPSVHAGGESNGGVRGAVDMRKFGRGVGQCRASNEHARVLACEQREPC